MKSKKFLIKIAELSGVEGCFVLEVGAGLGALTKELSKRARFVLAVEVDRRFAQALIGLSSGARNVALIFGDFLKVRESELKPPFLPAKSVSNLPYHISSKAIGKLLKLPGYCEHYVLVQREVAERMCASPGSRSYGALTVFVQCYAEPEVVLNVPPEAFYPEPEVESSLVRLKVRESPAADVVGDGFFRFVRGLFSERRKKVKNAVKKLVREGAGEVLREAGIDGDLRPEDLSVEEIGRLYVAVRKQQK